MTIGYEGLSIDRFLDLLRDGCVDTIVDVRQNPISRKKGFSKNALSQTVEASGFRYVHLLEFGCPKEIRDDYRQDGDWVRYTERYQEYLDTLDIPLTLLAHRAANSRCCLLCFEADPLTCHRSFVADRTATVAREAGIAMRVVHLAAAIRKATPA